MNPSALIMITRQLTILSWNRGPTGDFTYACRIDKVTCSTDLETVYAMCNAGNVFKGCVNHTGVAHKLKFKYLRESKNKNNVLVHYFYQEFLLIKFRNKHPPRIVLKIREFNIYIIMDFD